MCPRKVRAHYAAHIVSIIILPTATIIIIIEMPPSHKALPALSMGEWIGW